MPAPPGLAIGMMVLTIHLVQRHGFTTQRGTVAVKLRFVAVPRR